MKITCTAVALIASTKACLVDGDCGQTAPKAFLEYQKQLYYDYKKECLRTGKPDELGSLNYDPWGYQKSKYAYAEYKPNHNPYLREWRIRDDGRCYKSYRDVMSEKTLRSSSKPDAYGSFASRKSAMSKSQHHAHDQYDLYGYYDAYP